MESKEFVKVQVEKLSKKYPFTTIKYYFDSFDNDHFICINSKIDLNNIFSEQAMRDIDREFISKFPNELLSFVLLDDYLEFGEDGELVYEKNYKFSRLKNNNKNLNLFSVKDKNDYRFLANFELTLRQQKHEDKECASIEDDYALAA